MGTHQLGSVHGVKISKPLVHELLEYTLSTIDCLEKGNTEGYRKNMCQNKTKEKINEKRKKSFKQETRDK